MISSRFWSVASGSVLIVALPFVAFSGRQLHHQERDASFCTVGAQYTYPAPTTALEPDIERFVRTCMAEKGYHWDKHSNGCNEVDLFDDASCWLPSSMSAQLQLRIDRQLSGWGWP